MIYYLNTLKDSVSPIRGIFCIVSEYVTDNIESKSIIVKGIIVALVKKKAKFHAVSFEKCVLGRFGTFWGQLCRFFFLYFGQLLILL